MNTITSLHGDKLARNMIKQKVVIGFLRVGRRSYFHESPY